MRRLALLAMAVVGVGCGDTTPGVTGDGGGPGDGGVAVLPYGECAGGDQQAFGGEVVCLEDPAQTDPNAEPLAVVEHEFITYQGVPAVHIRLTLSPSFVDNTFGMTAVGWNKHSFTDLVGSDHAEILLLDSTGAVTFDISLDYLSADPDAPCGYSSLGVAGGEGRVLVGDESAILAWSTSLDRNLNERGYCDYTTDSPATDESCTPNPAAPDWDFRVTYEVWVALSAFDPNGFGSAHMDSVHASPSKTGTNTVTVQQGPCPPEYCADPDGCDNVPGGACDDANPCPGTEFCYDGTCLPIIE